MGEAVHSIERSSDSIRPSFTSYQKLVLGLLAFLQFTIILDFMVLSPLGATIMPELGISPGQFGLVVSAYAFSAGASGLLAAGFADRFDRKRILVVLYAGFLLGTLFCGLANSFPLLLAARTVTGLFGGVIGSVTMAIATDLFHPALRGRVMGVIQSAFSASQVLGIPVGLFLGNHWGWHAPFLMIVGLGTAVGVVIVTWMKPVDGHLHIKSVHSPLKHLVNTLTHPPYLIAFATTALLATGGYMLMPFGSAFTVNNLGVSLDRLPMIYLVSGLFTMFTGPLVGQATDRFGAFRVFAFGTCVSISTILLYTHLGHTPLWGVILINVIMFVGIFSRMIPSQAMMSSIPDPGTRGSFSAVGSSIQQIAGGIASLVAGLIVARGPDGTLLHFDRLGYVVATSAVVALMFMYRLSQRARA